MSSSPVSPLRLCHRSCIPSPSHSWRSRSACSLCECEPVSVGSSDHSFHWTSLFICSSRNITLSVFLLSFSATEKFFTQLRLFLGLSPSPIRQVSFLWFIELRKPPVERGCCSFWVYRSSKDVAAMLFCRESTLLNWELKPSYVGGHFGDN